MYSLELKFAWCWLEFVVQLCFEFAEWLKLATEQMVRFEV